MNSNIFKKLVQIEYAVTNEKIEFLLECLDNQYGNCLNEKEKQSYVLNYCKNNCDHNYKYRGSYIGTRGFIDDNELLHQFNQEFTISCPRNGITLM